MTSYFDEKSDQIRPGVIFAFGIMLISRHAKANEMSEMLEFAQKAVGAGVADAVEEVVYDSKASICSFKFSRKLALGDPTERKLFAAAKETIEQFDWFDTVHLRCDGLNS